MKKFRYLIIAAFLIFTMSMWSGCSEDDFTIDGKMWPGEWVVYHDSVAVTDTIHGFLCDCLIDIPAEGGTYRIRGLESNFFQSYEIEQPRDHRGLLTVTGEDFINDLCKYYVVKITPNESETSRLFTIHCHSLENIRNIRVNFYQSPQRQE